MKAVVFRGVGDIRLEEVAEPKIHDATDAIVRITASAICGTDLHFVRGTFPGLKPGTILGHEAVGVVEELGRDVRNLSVGDRVVIPSTIACGACSYCRAGYFSQCDVANPNGKLAGTAFFGGPPQAGGFPGLQAERARVPFAHVGLVRIPDEVTDDQAILLSDVFPTGWFAAHMAAIHPGATVAVLGCGPVGLLAIASLQVMGAGRIFAVDNVPDRLALARKLGAEVIDFEHEDPVEAIRRLTDGIGTDRVIDAVGVDASQPHTGPAAGRDVARAAKEAAEVSPERVGTMEWHPGDAPAQAVDWAVEICAKAGTLSVVGVYPEADRVFPLGKAMNRNLTVRMGNCPHRAFIPKLMELVRTGAVDPRRVISQELPVADAIDAYHHFDRHERGWAKVELIPPAVH